VIAKAWNALQCLLGLHDLGPAKVDLTVNLFKKCIRCQWTWRF
jgi:hypothetical protein